MSTTTITSTDTGSQSTAGGERREQIECYVVGALGGVMPTLITLAKSPSLPNWSFLLSIAIYAFLGWLIVYLHKERNRLKAFMLGVSAPAFISGAISTSTAPPPVAPPARQGYAVVQERAFALASEEGTAAHSLRLLLPAALNGTYVKRFLDTGTTEVIPGKPEMTISLDFVQKLEVGAQDCEPITLPTSVLRSGVVKVEAVENTWSGMLKGLGFQRAYRWALKIQP